MIDQGLFAQIDVSLALHAGETYPVPYNKLVAELESGLSPTDSWFNALPASTANLSFQYVISAVQMQNFSSSSTFCVSPYQRKPTPILNIVKWEESGAFVIDTLKKKSPINFQCR